MAWWNLLLEQGKHTHTKSTFDWHICMHCCVRTNTQYRTTRNRTRACVLVIFFLYRMASFHSTFLFFFHLLLYVWISWRMYAKIKNGWNMDFWLIRIFNAIHTHNDNNIAMCNVIFHKMNPITATIIIIIRTNTIQIKKFNSSSFFLYGIAKYMEYLFVRIHHREHCIGHIYLMWHILHASFSYCLDHRKKKIKVHAHAHWVSLKIARTMNWFQLFRMNSCAWNKYYILLFQANKKKRKEKKTHKPRHK